MPKLPFRRKPSSAHTASSSLLRFLFPKTRARARNQLSRFRLDTLPALKHRAQSRIYQYILRRQALKLQGRQTILQRVRGHTRRLIGGGSGSGSSSGYLENAARTRRQHLVKRSAAQTSEDREMTYQESYEAREPGTRRRKLAGYLKAANEIRQSYTQQYAPSWSSKEPQYDYNGEDDAGAFPDAAVVRSGEEEMILFPSYARKHIKRKPDVQPGTIQQDQAEGRDVRESTGAGDAEFWKKQWDNYEDDNAVVDVDVRGWIYSPHKGQMSRKQRLFIGLARQLVGVQAPPAESTSSASSRDTSPSRHGFRERTHMRDAQRDEAIAAREAEEILRKGEREARMAAMGAYSEKPAKDIDDTETYRPDGGGDMRAGNLRARQLAHSTSNSSMRSEESIQPLKKRTSWNQPSEMSPAELAEANARLMARLRHFLAIPMANTPITVFFYNDQISKQRTVYTDASGHFSMSAALDFIPTHVRILASDKLSATEKVLITDAQGISVISDIDDTIKHSAISSGAREIFRNVFIRDLADLTIDGVREWYNRMAEMGVKFHYVSNSPWQLYPVISKYFSLAGLPPGSFHLKQYSGMLQGIFEPVAERKKVTLDKIARDFPERNFILIGDSGEADLEVYSDFVIENPGRVVAVFIRDVTTTTETPGFFSPSMGENHSSSDASSTQQAGDSTTQRLSKSRPSEEDDPELRAAIAASLRDMDEENSRRSNAKSSQHGVNEHPDSRPPLPARKSSQPSPSSRTGSTPNLIDLSSDNEHDRAAALRRVYTDSKDTPSKDRNSASSAVPKSAPPPPRKPAALKGASADSGSGNPAMMKKPTPPQPRKPSTTLNQSSPLSQQPSSANTTHDTNPVAVPKPQSIYDSQSQSQQSYGGMAREKLWSVYNALPALRSTDDAPQSSSSTLEADTGRKAPPPPPPRRGNRETASSAASYVGSKASAAWQHAPSLPYASRPQITSMQTSQPFSSAAPLQRLNRTNTGSTIGTVGGEQYGTKREQLWRQRWARAEQVLGERGVLLRSWRVGTDLIGESERIIREAEKKWKDSQGQDSQGRK
ncbi:hypothetical protein IAQ61_009009 [Plenodomus lingam]|nr:hypothetical protein IAQ61_009009 [Plenodomus lingam]